MEKNLTKRQLQAIETKNKIQFCAKKLIRENGYENVSVRDICAASGVATGTFYLYFPSKSDLFVSSYEGNQNEVANNINFELESKDTLTKIKVFFLNYIKYNEDFGVDGLKIVFSDWNKYRSGKLGEILKHIILDGQKKGELSTEISADEMYIYLISAARGLLHEWCIGNGGFNLQERAYKYITLLISSLPIK